MANLFSHPFRLTPKGKVVTVDQDTDQYLAERIAVIVQTRPGERPMAPEFGIDDPAFGSISLPELEFQFEMFELPIVIDELTQVDISDGQSDYNIQFHRDETTDDEDYDEEEG
ncbi:tail lysozyme [Brevibacterium phage Cantare]|uniref:Tail lysozyme n=1 Tax=Brevibacterium phage Cantare TaxID=2338395 RepID=A0A3G3LYP2_9CAUD|nr:baseplate protein [Brevibacterium phage Cantare]AYQ99249.1 tail lysozyme [Brevibacterium phage Cantare]